MKKTRKKWKKMKKQEKKKRTSPQKQFLFFFKSFCASLLFCFDSFVFNVFKVDPKKNNSFPPLQQYLTNYSQFPFKFLNCYGECESGIHILDYPETASICYGKQGSEERKEIKWEDKKENSLKLCLLFFLLICYGECESDIHSLDYPETALICYGKQGSKKNLNKEKIDPENLKSFFYFLSSISFSLSC